MTSKCVRLNHLLKATSQRELFVWSVASLTYEQPRSLHMFYAMAKRFSALGPEREEQFKFAKNKIRFDL